MANRLVLHMRDRVVHWDLPDDNITAILAQNLVSALGPAEEGTGD